MPGSAPRPPRGPHEVKRALMDACERLCATRIPRRVTVRDVAAEANVTPGLVHHYFESKDDLLVATTRSIAGDVGHAARRVYETTGDPGATVAVVWRFFELRPAFRAIVMWWALDGRDVTDLLGEHPFLELLARALGAPDDQAVVSRTSVIAMLILVAHLGPGLNRAVGLAADDTAAVREIERITVELARGDTTVP